MNENFKSIQDVNLQPQNHSAEQIKSHVCFLDRSLTLEFEFMSHGYFAQELTIYFNKPQDMLNLANSLIKVAKDAEEYFKEYP